MDNPFGKSWLTTVIGILAAALNAIVPLLQNGTVDLQTLVMSAAIAALGVVSKSYNVSGSQ